MLYYILTPMDHGDEMCYSYHTTGHAHGIFESFSFIHTGHAHGHVLVLELSQFVPCPLRV